MWAPYFICANDEHDFKEWLTALISVVSRSNPADDFEYNLDKFIAQWYVFMTNSNLLRNYLRRSTICGSDLDREKFILLAII